jgi:hypothetical protein
VLSQYQGQETNLPHVLASSTLDVYGIVPPAPTVSQFFCNDNVINDWVTPAHVENKLTINSLNFFHSLEVERGRLQSVYPLVRQGARCWAAAGPD